MDTLTKVQWKNHVENQKGSGIEGRKTRLFAKVSSKGRVTIPKAVREKLRITEGDNVMFLFGDQQEDQQEDQRAVMTRIPDLRELAGVIEVPEHLRGLSWEEIRDIARRERAKKWR